MKMISLGGPQLLSKEKRLKFTQKLTTMRPDSTLHDDSTSDFNLLFLLCKVDRVCNETRARVCGPLI